MTRRSLLLSALAGACLLAGSGARAEQLLASAKFVPTPPLPKPGLLQPATDSAFGTAFMRVTGGGETLGPDMICGAQYCTHRYSSSQAWNADQSLLLITDGCSGACFLDGKTYKPLFHRPMSDQCEWHPLDPQHMICVAEREIYIWAPRTDARTTVYASTDYTHLQFGPYKGNPSRDGSKLVLVALDSSGAPVTFAYDVVAKKKYPDIKLTGLEGKTVSCTISPSGQYILCFQELPDERNVSYIFRTSGERIQYWPENHRPGHGDMMPDADGSDVYVGVSKSDPDKYHIIKRRLQDGAVTDLVPFGEGQHVSLRNINTPGWAFVTYSGTEPELAEHSDWAPFYEEIVALKIDGSGEIRRLVHTRAGKGEYWNEAHGSPSPDGSQVIWSSNWDIAGGPVEDYVARVAWPTLAAPEQAAASAEPRGHARARRGSHRPPPAHTPN